MSDYDFKEKIKVNHVPWDRNTVEIIQVNIGKLCNQVCTHCHVGAGPGRLRENMSRSTLEQIIAILDNTKGVTTVDVTGGAPELNPNFRWFVGELRSRDYTVIDRCNLTVLYEPNQDDLSEFLSQSKVNIVASLPCYSVANVDKQRGDGVFDKSIRALQELNSKGYGKEDSGLNLDLVYNPVGTALPGDQVTLELDYKAKLFKDFGILFNKLYTITNMPIKRFLYELKSQGKYQDYMDTLVRSFNPVAASQVMCRSMISISWDGLLYDCDFNQALSMPILGDEASIWDVEDFQFINKNEIVSGPHCFGCTAGAGSSCGGSLV